MRRIFSSATLKDIFLGFAVVVVASALSCWITLQALLLPLPDTVVLEPDAPLGPTP